MHTLRTSILSALLFSLLIAPFAFADDDDNKGKSKGKDDDKKSFNFNLPFTSVGTTTSALQEQIKKLQDLIKSYKAQREALDDNDGDDDDNASSTKAMRDALKMDIKDTKDELKQAKKDLKFARSLTRGMKGDDVRDLQELLAQDPTLLTSDSITGFFGPKTEAALRAFQKKHGIDAIGVFGPKSQAKILALFIGRELPPGIVKRLGLETSSTTPGQGFLTVCHKPVGSAQQTLVIAIPALGAHLGHGDAVGVCSGTGTTTPPVIDTTKPIISNIAISGLSSTTASVGWTTNENATGKLYYATSTPINLSTAWTMLTASSMSHTSALVGLMASTTYYYVIEAKDAANNIATSSASSFLTQ